MKFRQRHLIRAGLVLLVILGAAFVVPRLLPKQISYELKPYGFYTGRDNSSEWASLSLKYADPAKCNSCHADKTAIWKQAEHKSVSCEDCHGPGEAHVEKAVPLVVDKSRELCAQCHNNVVGRPADFPQVDVSSHGGSSQCVTCHNPHDPLGDSKDQGKGQKGVVIPTVPHSIQGRAECLQCHKAGGIKPFPQDHAGRSQDTCLSCHKGGGK